MAICWLVTLGLAQTVKEAPLPTTTWLGPPKMSATPGRAESQEVPAAVRVPPMTVPFTFHVGLAAGKLK